MNEKLNIQELIDLLAEKHGMNRKDADNFVKEFFLLIEESLEKDKYVKIRGLGTFKLIDVDSRESVNVNTGERFEIQGHTKVSFTPEPTLKDLVNKPFSHFETVALNDNTVLDDTPLDAESEDEEETISPEREIPLEKELSKGIEETDFQEKATTEQEEELAKAATKQAELAIAATETSTEVLEAVSVKDARHSADASTMRYFISIIVFIVMLCGGAVTFMYYPDLLDSFTSPPAVAEEHIAKADETITTDRLNTKEIIEQAKTDTVAEVLATTSDAKETPQESVSQPVSPKEQKKTATKSLEPDSVGYTIDGTETTYTIKEGETLTKVALHFYGTKALWPYIVKHNPGVIKNPDNVPFGTTIKIPKLVKKQ